MDYLITSELTKMLNEKIYGIKNYKLVRDINPKSLKIDKKFIFIILLKICNKEQFSIEFFFSTNGLIFFWKFIKNYLRNYIRNPVLYTVMILQKNIQNHGPQHFGDKALHFERKRKEQFPSCVMVAHASALREAAGV